MQDIGGVPNAHEVADFVFRQERGRELDDWILHFGWLADADAPDGHASEGQGRHILGAFLPEVFVDAALDDAKEVLPFSGRG